MSDKAASPAGVYGKIAAQGDFLRANAGSFSRAGLDLWFQEGVEILHKEGTKLPDERTSFLLAPESSSGAFIGAFVPSVDAVGRSFPLSVFTEVSVARDTDHLTPLPRVFCAFFEAAGALAEASRNLAADELGTRAHELPLDPETGAPGPSDWEREPSMPLASALGGSPRALSYAMRTFAAACDQAAKVDASVRATIVVVDAPAPTAATRQMWLEFARRQIRSAGQGVSAIWTSGIGGRILLALGPPPPALFAYLANPKHRASRLWPLRTEVESALDQAEQGLTPEQRKRVGDPEATLGELATPFCRGA